MGYIFSPSKEVSTTRSKMGIWSVDAPYGCMIRSLWMPLVLRSSILKSLQIPQSPGVPLKIAGAKPLQFSHSKQLMDAPSFQEFHWKLQGRSPCNFPIIWSLWMPPPKNFEPAHGFPLWMPCPKNFWPAHGFPLWIPLMDAPLWMPLVGAPRLWWLQDKCKCIIDFEPF